jgi:CubicO group peptidase (beta-lactamase class C family)
MLKKPYILATSLLFLSMSIASGHAESEPRRSNIQEQLVKIEQRFGVAAQSVKILKNGEPIFSGQQGFANIQLSSPIQDNNKYPVYSISKLFTNVLLMKLVEDGRLEINKSIRHYLPSLPLSWQHITVAHAWNHVSGLPEFFSLQVLNEGEIPNKMDVFETVQYKPLEYKTGSRTSYNQTGFMVITAILEKLYASPHPQLVDDIITSPLGLDNTGYAGSREIVDRMVTAYSGQDGVIMQNPDLNWPAYAYAFSALYSTPADLTKFMNAIYNQYFVKAETLETLWKPMPRNDGQLGGFAQGWFWGESGRFNYVGHTGGNNVKLRQYYTDLRGGDTYTIAYLTSGSSTNIYIDNLVDEVMAILDPEHFFLEKLGVDLFDLSFSSANQT